jgi:glucan phosphoethanolaminetransferase (alkaline phosphatase superfamily)
MKMVRRGEYHTGYLIFGLSMIAVAIILIILATFVFPPPLYIESKNGVYAFSTVLIIIGLFTVFFFSKTKG